MRENKNLKMEEGDLTVKDIQTVNQQMNQEIERLEITESKYQKQGRQDLVDALNYEA